MVTSVSRVQTRQHAHTADEAIVANEREGERGRGERERAREIKIKSHARTHAYI